jgi:hypothetical protein
MIVLISPDPCFDFVAFTPNIQGGYNSATTMSVNLKAHQRPRTLLTPGKAQDFLLNARVGSNKKL